MNLADKYRPTTLEDVCGQERAVAALRLMMQRGLGGECLWFSGPSGVGKTTLALIAAHSIAIPTSVVEWTGREMTPTDAREIGRLKYQRGLTAGTRDGRVWIINEAHGLRRAVIEVLLDALEPMTPWSMVIATTTKDGQEQLFDETIDAGPLLSRFTEIRLTKQGMAPAAAARLKWAAEQEGLDGRPLKDYVALMHRDEVGCSMRVAFKLIGRGAMLPD